MDGLSFIRELGRRLTAITGDPRETTFLLQRISVAVQLGNVASIMGTLPARHETDYLDIADYSSIQNTFILFAICYV